MERPATAWLVQWQVAGDPKMTTTWYWAFNHLAAQTFDRDALSTSILRYARARQWSRIAEKTVTRDVECFIRGYVPLIDKAAGEDALEPVLAELGLIQPVAARLYEFRRGPKPSLPDAVFAFALNAFWGRYAPNAATLSVEAIAYEPGSPGRVFKLDENSVVERLTAMEDVTRSHRLVGHRGCAPSPTGQTDLQSARAACRCVSGRERQAAGRMTLGDHVEIARRFQRSIRLDTDLVRVDALQGFVCQRRRASGYGEPNRTHRSAGIHVDRSLRLRQVEFSGKLGRLARPQTCDTNRSIDGARRLCRTGFTRCLPA
jgi:hypothetical protein